MVCNDIRINIMTKTQSLMASLRIIGASCISVIDMAAQCNSQWAPGESFPGVDGEVYAMVEWDPDGAGPISPRLVVGGSFTIAGGVVASNIATLDRQTGAWAPLGSGTSGAVRSLCVMPDGSLAVGGDFATAGGGPVANIARWNGSSWLSIAGGTNGRVSALTVLANGDLVAGGSFTSAGGAPANYIAKWDGVAWSPLGLGMGAGAGGPTPRVLALAVRPGGQLIAGGEFITAGGVTVNRIAAWDGANWSDIGGVFPALFEGAGVYSLAVLPNGHLVAGGLWNTVAGLGGSRCIALWNGSTWSSFGSLAAPGAVWSLAVSTSGEIFAGGTFGDLGSRVARRTLASSWAQLGSGVGTGTVLALAALQNGELAVGGQGINTASGVAVSGLAMWNGASWSSAAPGLDAQVACITSTPQQQWIVGGDFVRAGGVSAARIARFDGLSWSPLAGGLDGPVRAVCALPNGDVVAGGSFAAANGSPASSIAVWSAASNTWGPLGLGMNPGSVVSSLVRLPNGHIVAGGDFTQAGGVAANRVAVWNGSTWTPLGGGMNGAVNALAVLPNGDLVAAGSFTGAGTVPANRIALWNGLAWSALGSGLNNSVNALAVLPNGSIVAGGTFTSAGGVSRSRIALWNGTAWSGLGTGLNGTCLALASLPNGDVVAAGQFGSAGGVTANRIARWNGASWAALGSGADNNVAALAFLPSGQLALGGSFKVANGVVSTRFARLVTPCVAASVAAGGGCPSSGGGNSYASVTLPWTGSTYRTRGTGLPVFAFVAVVNGFSATSIPLAVALPPAPPGCTLLASPDVLEVTISNAGVVDAQIVIPNTASLAGIVLHQQLVALEVDAGLNPVQNTTTNALVATVGTF